MKKLIILLAILFLTACSNPDVKIKTKYLEYFLTVCDNNQKMNHVTVKMVNGELFRVVIECNDGAIFTKYITELREAINE